MVRPLPQASNKELKSFGHSHGPSRFSHEASKFSTFTCPKKPKVQGPKQVLCQLNKEISKLLKNTYPQQTKFARASLNSILYQALEILNTHRQM